jgi:hypothetical protein
MEWSVGLPLAGVPLFNGTIRRGDKRQPYTNWFFRRFSRPKQFDCVDISLTARQL